MILFEDLRPALNYFPISYNQAEIKNVNGWLLLTVDNVQWCALHHDYRELRQQFAEINLSYGDVVTTGLGFGMLQTALLNKKEVKSVTVYERNRDVIEMFKQICYRNNFDISRLNIINDDANNMKDVECDWLLMDHFELHTYWEKVDTMRHIVSNNNAKNVWFWSITACFQDFVSYKNNSYAYEGFDAYKKKQITIELFDLFVDTIKIKNLYRLSKQPEYFKYFDMVI